LEFQYENLYTVDFGFGSTELKIDANETTLIVGASGSTEVEELERVVNITTQDLNYCTF